MRQQHTIRSQADLVRYLGAPLARSVARLTLPEFSRRIPAWLAIGENSGAQLIGPGDDMLVFRLCRKGGAPVLVASERGSSDMADFYRHAGSAGDLMPTAEEVLLFALVQESPAGKSRRWTATAALGSAVPRPAKAPPEDAPFKL